MAKRSAYSSVNDRASVFFGGFVSSIYKAVPAASALLNSPTIGPPVIFGGLSGARSRFSNAQLHGLFEIAQR
jgi:hypothetical protein